MQVTTVPATTDCKAEGVAVGAVWQGARLAARANRAKIGPDQCQRKPTLDPSNPDADPDPSPNAEVELVLQTLT